MHLTRHVALACGLLVAALSLCSCVERKERLNVSPSGSVHYMLEFKSDSVDDLYEGDAVPRIAGGWLANQEVEVDDDGRQTYRLIAETVFAPGAQLPSNFALRTEADADLYLQFPTTVRIEQRPDGTYYHFTRTYQPRAWTVVRALEERLLILPLREFSHLQLREWTPEQRLTAVRAFADFETEKMLVFARAAFRITTPEMPQDAWLRVRQYVLGCVEHYDFTKLATLLEPREETPEEELREEVITAELKEMRDLIVDQLKQSLFTQAGYDGEQYNRFMIAFDRQNRSYEITDDLGDDRFEIVLELPGEIIASNAETMSGNSATWTFDGGIVRDRELELLATSRVAK